MPDLQFFDFLVIGQIQTEYIIDLHNSSREDVLGGSALYASGGLRCWSDRVAVMSHTHAKNQRALSKAGKKYQIDFEGIQYHDDFYDDRCFIGHLTPCEVVNENPVAFYASKRIPLPKNLIGYQQNNAEERVEHFNKFHPEDIPTHYRDVTATLLCHASIKNQLQLSSMLSKTSTQTLVIQASDQYMKMEHFDKMPLFLKGVTSLITTKEQITDLFHNRAEDLWEMAALLCEFGCEHVVINDGRSGQYLFDKRTQKRFHAAAYPGEWINPTGAAEAFCGGFIAGLKKKYDPIEALLCGIVSASFTVEGSGPFYCADCVPELVTSRKQYARELIKPV